MEGDVFMSLIPFNRKNNVFAHRDSVMNMLDSFFNDTWMSTRSLWNDTFKIDVKETDKEYIIEAELPGVEKKEITLNMREGVLTIAVERSEQNESRKENYIHQERKYASMQRTVHLADASDDDVKATLKDGVLLLTVHKDEKKKDGRKIEIK
jgi:HSP20 family protein